MRALLALLLLLAAPALAAPAGAQTPQEAAYLAERDRANAALEANWDQDAHDRAVESLTRQIKRIVGPPLHGFNGKSEMNTTLCCGVGSGKLDGMAYGDVVVTTEGLLGRWLAALGTPRDVAAGIEEGADLYSNGLVGEAAVTVYAGLPIVRPPGATRAVAHLALASQADALWPPQEIGVIVQKGERVFLTYQKVTTAPALPACDNALAQGLADARAAWEAGRRDDLPRLEAEAETAYVSCWNAHAREAAAWRALVQQAQQLADALAAD
jgi:hypothetical protein